MTTSARHVLEDCKVALECLRSKPEGRQWRIAWVVNITLLRAVGHVLKEVDKAHMQFSIDLAWKRWNDNKLEHTIFFDFIKNDRDLLLHEYEFSAWVSTTIKTKPAHLVIDKDGTMHQINSNGAPAVDDVHLDYVISSGKFKGRNQLDVIQEAINWWKHELHLIDEHAAAIAV